MSTHASTAGGQASLVVVIVSYQTRDALGTCLDALRKAVPPDSDVVVVDNASTDGSAELVRREHGWARLVSLEHNRGFAAGVNEGVAASNAEFVLVLNPDVLVTRDALGRLLRTLTESPDAAAVSPLLVGDDGRPQTWLYRRFPSAPQVLLFWTVLRPLASLLAPLRRRWLEHNLRSGGVRSVDQLPGGAMLLRRDALQRVGPLDEDYFVWFEDVDWSRRARLAGWRLLVDTETRFAHEGGASFRGWALELRLFQFQRAGLRLLGKLATPRVVSLAGNVVPLDFALRCALLGLVGRGSSAAREDAARALRCVAARVRQGRLPAFTGPAPTDVAVASVDRYGSAEARAGGGADAEHHVDIDVVVINWNGRRYLPRCLEALRRSTVRVRIVVVDNASGDGSVDYLRRDWPDVEVASLHANRGYAGGANEGLRRGRARYAFLMNPDLLVEPDHLAILCDRLDAQPDIGAAQGRLYHLDVDTFLSGAAPPAAVLDSAGQRVSRTRMAFDRGQGASAAPEHEVEASVFSACGAGLFLRRDALLDLAEDGWLDETFFAYKEDVDLCWRLRLHGWDIRYVPAAVAHHVRALPGSGRRVHGVPAFARRHSWMNHWLMMIKNDRIADLLRDLPWLAGWEALRFGHALLRDPALLPAYVEVWRHVPGALRQRYFVQACRRVSGADIRQWFGADAFPPAMEVAPPVATIPSGCR